MHAAAKSDEIPAIRGIVTRWAARSRYVYRWQHAISRTFLGQSGGHLHLHRRGSSRGRVRLNHQLEWNRRPACAGLALADNPDLPFYVVQLPTLAEHQQ